MIWFVTKFNNYLYEITSLQGGERINQLVNQTSNQLGKAVQRKTEMEKQIGLSSL